MNTAMEMAPAADIPGGEPLVETKSENKDVVIQITNQLQDIKKKVSGIFAFMNPKFFELIDKPDNEKLQKLLEEGCVTGKEDKKKNCKERIKNIAKKILPFIWKFTQKAAMMFLTFYILKKI
jgi:hypothetical protein